MHVKFTHKIMLSRNLEMLLLFDSERHRSVTSAKVISLLLSLLRWTWQWLDQTIILQRIHNLSPLLYEDKRDSVNALTRWQTDYWLLHIYERRIIVIILNYLKVCYNGTTMLYRLLFIQGKAYWLFKIHCIPSWAVWQINLDFTPNSGILVYREREQQVNYLNNYTQFR